MSAVSSYERILPRGKVLLPLAERGDNAANALLKLTKRGEHWASRRSDTDHSKDELLLTRIHLGESVGKVANALNERVARFER